MHGDRSNWSWRILKVSNRKMGVVLPGWPRWTKIAGIAGILLLSLGLSGWRPSSDGSVTLMFLDPEWSHDLSEDIVLPDERLQEFARQRGIRVNHLPAPQSGLHHLALPQHLL